jgi:hypothetical protein
MCSWGRPLILRGCDHYTSSTLIGGKGGAGPSSLLLTMLEEPTNGVCECKMVDAKFTWWHRMDHVFMVIWTMFKNHLLEVGLTQNRETMALWMLVTVDLFYFIMCEDPVWIENHWNNSIWLKARSHMTSHDTRGSVTTLHDFGGVLGRHLDIFF